MIKEISLSYTKIGKRTWLAKINGPDDDYNFEREFLAPDEFRDVSRSGKTGYMVFWLGDGVYEQCERGRRQILHIHDGQIDSIDSDRAHEIVG